jgi:hypothetical protein
MRDQGHRDTGAQGQLERRACVYPGPLFSHKNEHGHEHEHEHPRSTLFRGIGTMAPLFSSRRAICVSDTAIAWTASTHHVHIQTQSSTRQSHPLTSHLSTHAQDHGHGADNHQSINLPLARVKIPKSPKNIELSALPKASATQRQCSKTYAVSARMLQILLAAVFDTSRPVLAS